MALLKNWRADKITSMSLSRDFLNHSSLFVSSLSYMFSLDSKYIFNVDNILFASVIFIWLAPPHDLFPFNFYHFNNYTSERKKIFALVFVDKSFNWFFELSINSICLHWGDRSVFFMWFGFNRLPSYYVYLWENFPLDVTFHSISSNCLRCFSLVLIMYLTVAYYWPCIK